MERTLGFQLSDSFSGQLIFANKTITKVELVLSKHFTDSPKPILEIPCLQSSIAI
ncbi:Uncharacterised protein [Streptococcus pneumoniae]|nr:Uncharacterised protein [Streptococcus pneumoniae]